MRTKRSSVGSGTPVTVMKTKPELSGTMMSFGLMTGVKSCVSTGTVIDCWMPAPPRIGKAFSVNTVVPVIVQPTEPLGARPKGATTGSIVTFDAFSVSQLRMTFVDALQPRAGFAEKKRIAGSPGSMTVAVNVAVAAPQEPPGTVRRTTSVPVVEPALYVNWLPFTVNDEPVEPCVSNVIVTSVPV